MRRSLSSKPPSCGHPPRHKIGALRIYFHAVPGIKVKVGCGGAIPSDEKYYHAPSNTANHNEIFRRFTPRE